MEQLFCIMCQHCLILCVRAASHSLYSSVTRAEYYFLLYKNESKSNPRLQNFEFATGRDYPKSSRSHLVIYMALTDSHKACLAMAFMQLLYAGMALLSKAALNKGMSNLVFVVYRQATATIALAPMAYILERRKTIPMSFAVFCKIFLLSLFGITLSMDLYYMGLRYTSATIASAAINIIPAVTFSIAFLLRLETVNWRRIYGQFKIIGMALSVTGAVLITLYKGPPLKLLNWHAQGASLNGNSSTKSHRGEEKMTQIKGPLLMFTAFICWSTWVIMQARVLKAYPAKLSLTTLQCLLSTIQSGVIAVAVDRNIKVWNLGWDLQLISVIYCGVFVSGVSYWLQIWCVEKKGPVYVAMFSPLSVIITAITAAFLWAESLYLGSLLGELLIICGLYCVLWGKSKEVKDVSLDNASVTKEVAKDEIGDIERGKP